MKLERSVSGKIGECEDLIVRILPEEKDLYSRFLSLPLSKLVVFSQPLSTGPGLRIYIDLTREEARDLGW